MIVQTTLAKAVSFKGNGLHSGLPVTITLNPAEVDTGIEFVRIDLDGTPRVKAHISNVTNTMRATTLENGEAKVFTVEHLMAALFSLGIDNCTVYIDSPEPPVADGGADTFVKLIQEAGIASQDKEKNTYAIQKAQTIYDEDRFIMIVPYDGLRVTFTSLNQHPLLGTQYADYEITADSFAKEIAPARTIGFMKELDALKEMGLAKGGTLQNALVYDDEKCLSEPIFEDELVRHKILDVLGDISLLGRPIKGHIIAVKSSHELNSRLSKKILEEMQEG